MIGTVSLINTATGRAGARRVARVDRDNRNAHQLRLVLDLRPEVVKRPVRVSCPLLAPKPLPVADAGQVFDGDPAPGVRRFL